MLAVSLTFFVSRTPCIYQRCRQKASVLSFFILTFCGKHRSSAILFRYFYLKYFILGCVLTFWPFCILFYSYGILVIFSDLLCVNSLVDCCFVNSLAKCFLPPPSNKIIFLCFIYIQFRDKCITIL